MKRDYKTITINIGIRIIKKKKKNNVIENND